MTRAAKEGRAELEQNAERLGADEHKVLLSVADVAAIYGVSRSYAYALKGSVPWYRFGGVKFRREDIERFLESDRKIVPSGRAGTKQRGARCAAGRDEDAEEAHDHELRARFGF